MAIFTTKQAVESLKKSLPWIFIVLGICSLSFGHFGNYEAESKLDDFLKVIGTTLLSSGVFAVVLKSMQLMGVFKEELLNIIYEGKYLENRKDLDDIWDRVSKALFRNKFPNISKKILHDIKNAYFPTGEVIYYDDQEHYVDIKISNDDILTIDQKVNLNIVCVGKTQCFNYEFSNTMTFYESESEVGYEIGYIKVNKEEKIVGQYDYKKTLGNKQISNKFVVKLEGEEKYEIDRQEIRKFSILKDDTISFKSAKLTNGLVVEINHPRELEVTFQKMGTIKSFEERRNTETYKKYVYKDIIHKEQGYFIRIKKNVSLN